MTHLLTSLGGNTATVPWVDGEGAAFRNYTMVHFSDEFEVGASLLKAVYCRLVEDRCESNRQMELRNTDCLAALLPREDAGTNFTDIERIAASGHISLRDLLDSAYKVLPPGAPSDAHSVKQSSNCCLRRC